MDIIYEEEPKKAVEETRIRDLEPGTVFRLGNECLALKVKTNTDRNGNDFIILTFSDGGEWFVITDNSMTHYSIKEVHGRLTGLQVRRAKT